MGDHMIKAVFEYDSCAHVQHLDGFVLEVMFEHVGSNADLRIGVGSGEFLPRAVVPGQCVSLVVGGFTQLIKPYPHVRGAVGKGTQKTHHPKFQMPDTCGFGLELFGVVDRDTPLPVAELLTHTTVENVPKVRRLIRRCITQCKDRPTYNQWSKDGAVASFVNTCVNEHDGQDS